MRIETKFDLCDSVKLKDDPWDAIWFIQHIRTNQDAAVGPQKEEYHLTTVKDGRRVYFTELYEDNMTLWIRK